MATTTKSNARRRPRVEREAPAVALARIESGFSGNDEAVVYAFAERGIDPAAIDPRRNVLTFNAWKAKGRRVARGATGVAVTTWTPTGEGADDGPAPQPGEQSTRPRKMRPVTAHLFHESQTVEEGAPKGTRPAAWQNPALVKAGTYGPEDGASADDAAAASSAAVALAPVVEPAPAPAGRVLTFDDIGAAYRLPEAECAARAAELVAAFRAVDAITPDQRDAAGVAIRGTSVWYDLLEGSPWTIQQMAAAHVTLRRAGCERRVLDALELCRGAGA